MYEVLPEVAQVRLTEIYDIPETVDEGLLRALDAVAERDSELTLDEHTCTILLVIFVSESARMHTKHVGQASNDLRKDPHPLILIMMHRVLRSVHENRLALRVLMHIKESYYALAPVGILLTEAEKAAHRNYLWDESLINLFLFIFPVGIPLIIIGLLFVVLDEHSVHIFPEERAPVVPVDHAIRVDHWNDLKDKSTSKLTGYGVLCNERL